MEKTIYYRELDNRGRKQIHFSVSKHFSGNVFLIVDSSLTDQERRLAIAKELKIRLDSFDLRNWPK